MRKDIHRDLRAAAPQKELEDVVRAVAAAQDALEEGELERATELLTWSKAVAPRSAIIREALGVTHYLAGRFDDAHSELLAYRRLTERQDQNHLLADCARALGRHGKVSEYVYEMADADVPTERVVEGLIVLAGDKADRQDYDGALATLDRAELDPATVRPYHPRLWYAAADICERMGDTGRARDYFEAITAVTDEFFDVDERLAALEGR